MTSKSYSLASANRTGTNGSTSGPCKCCPYGFHIDTDFVRYCDALLTALYGNNRSLTNTTCRSFGSLRRKLNLALTSPELFSSPTNKSFLSFCDFNSKNSQPYPLAHSCFDNNESSFSLQEHAFVRRPHRSLVENHFNSSTSIETASSATACEAELNEAVNKFEEVLESKCFSKSNLYASNANIMGAHESPPPSPAPSSCPSSSISKSVLTQIRNHLALSITRVKELENQVAQIPFLKEQIVELEAQRNELLAKLSSAQQSGGQHSNRIAPKVDEEHHLENINASSHFATQRLSYPDFGTVSHTTTPTLLATAKQLNTFTPTRLSFARGESISIVGGMSEPNVKDTRSIGTLTSFAPSLPRKNAFIQTDLKWKDLTVKVDSKSTGTLTDLVARRDASYQVAPQTQSTSTDTDDLNSYVVLNSQSVAYLQSNNVSSKDASVQVSFENDQGTAKVVPDKSVFTSDLPSSVARPTSLDIMTDSSNHWLSSLNCSSPSSSSHSIRLCDKCHEMVNSITWDNLCPQDITSFAMPKIIKSDSGISVERRQADNKATDEVDNPILAYPDFEMFSSLNTQSSEDQDLLDKPKVRPIKKPLDYNSVQPSNDTKAALKVINENLLEPKKSNSFLFAKSVSVIKKVWFKISSSDDSDSRIVELYLDCFEKFSSRLLDFLVNLSDTNGNTAMHYAISYNNFDIVSVLLDSKVCDVNKFNKAGYTATMLVSLAHVESDVIDVVDRLFHQADVNMKAKQNGQTALMLAAASNRVEICRMLLDHGAEVNLQDNDGSTALMCASEHSARDVISLLLSHPDCDPLLEDNEGSTALKIALINGHNEAGILLYTGTRITNYYTSSHSLSRLPNSPISGHLRRAGSFSYSPGQSSHNASALSLRTSPPRNRHCSMSTPSSPSSRS